MAPSLVQFSGEWYILIYTHTNINIGLYKTYIIWLSAKRCASCRVGVLTANKIRFKHFVLLLCMCVHNWSILQWKQYQSQIWSCWHNIYFWKWKRHGIRPLKMDTLTVSAFDAFIHVHDESKHYLSHWFVQRRYCFTQRM